MSLGVATATGARTTPAELIATADAQLHLAERNRNAVRAPALPTG